jgi:hypothetical protein
VSVVANVAINLDATGVSSQLKAIHAASLNAANGIKQFADRVKAAKAATEAAQGGFAKASTVQGVFAANVKNTRSSDYGSDCSTKASAIYSSTWRRFIPESRRTNSTISSST